MQLLLVKQEKDESRAKYEFSNDVVNNERSEISYLKEEIIAKDKTIENLKVDLQIKEDNMFNKDVIVDSEETGSYKESEGGNCNGCQRLKENEIHLKKYLVLFKEKSDDKVCMCLFFICMYLISL